MCFGDERTDRQDIKAAKTVALHAMKALDGEEVGL
jgi:hypothetical protein